MTTKLYRIEAHHGTVTERFPLRLNPETRDVLLEALRILEQHGVPYRRIDRLIATPEELWTGNHRDSQ